MKISHPVVLAFVDLCVEQGAEFNYSSKLTNGQYWQLSGPGGDSANEFMNKCAKHYNIIASLTNNFRPNLDFTGFMFDCKTLDNYTCGEIRMRKLRKSTIVLISMYR